MASRKLNDQVLIPGEHIIFLRQRVHTGCGVHGVSYKTGSCLFTVYLTVLPVSQTIAIASVDRVVNE